MIVNKPTTYDYTMPRPPRHDYISINASQKLSNNNSKLGYNSNLSSNSNLGGHPSASTMNYYSSLLQPTTRMSGIAGSSNGSSNISPSTRHSVKYSASYAAAKNVSFYRSGDAQMQSYKVALTRRNFRTFDSLLEALSDRIPLPFGVRTISTPSGTHGINRLEEFEDGKSYVCSDKKTVKPINLNAVHNNRPPWFISKPKTRTRAVAQLVRRSDEDNLRVPLRLTQVKTPKKIIIVRNGDPTFRHSILLSRRTPQSFESILEDIGEIFRMRVQKLFTADGRKIDSLQGIYIGPSVFIAAGREVFQPMEYKLKRPVIVEEGSAENGDLVSELKERTPKELKKTKGKWQVTVITSELPAAGTDSKINITVYGAKGHSGPILLNNENKTHFRSGNEDQFVISVGSIGEIRKVRITHDNTGSSPGWLCDSLILSDVTTGETLTFPCNRWLSRNEDDGEICREIAATVADKPVLLEITYIISLTTGDLWNAGTDAPIAVTLFGDMGDSGPRMVQQSGRPLPQIKGKTSVYRLKAINLGMLHRVVIGHENTNVGAGWYLEQIAIKEDRVGSEEWIFTCNKWLDYGEDDNQIIRELYVDLDVKSNPNARNHGLSEKSREDQLWELEKWKYNRGNHLVFINHATEKALRVRGDAGIDGLGDPSHPQCAFEVARRRKNIRVFFNVAQTSFHLALDQNRILGQGKGGTFCEFLVKVQPDRSVLLESCRYHNQHATVDPSGKAADTRGHASQPGRLFTVYVKGCFRHESVILFNTSLTQALAVTSTGDVIGTGYRNDSDDDVTKKQFSYYRVIKIAEGVRMFQCVRDTRKFLRIKDGQCDGLGSGDVYCHFKVQKYKLGGYVTLQSMKHRGVFIGLNTNGKARPTVDTGDINTQFFVEVIMFGEKRKEHPEQWATPEPSFIVSPAVNQLIKSRDETPVKPKTTSTSVTLREISDTGPNDGDYRIYVTTGNSGTLETINLHVYGDKGKSGPITLGKGGAGGVFQCGQTDEFQANLSAVGNIKKIRIGCEEATLACNWRLKQVKMKEMATNEVTRFKFGRWVSRTQDDGATLRELAPISQDGNPLHPVLRYLVSIRTSKRTTSPRKTTSRNKTSPVDLKPMEVYLCLVGENGDSGRRLLLRKPVKESTDDSNNEHPPKPLFLSGQLDKFEVEAVNLGELTKCILSCPTTHASTPSTTDGWKCDEIIVRESEGSKTEYVFTCKRLLGGNKVGAKQKLSLRLTEKREIKRKLSDLGEFKEGDWKISLTTGRSENSATTANVMFHAFGSDGSSSGPILLAKGTKELFTAGTTERFKVNLSGVNDLQKVRLSHDNSGSSPSWFVERVKLKRANSEEMYSLEGNQWLSLVDEPYDLSIEIPIPKPGQELLPVYRYQVLVYTGSILGSDTDANVFICIYGDRGNTGRRVLYKSRTHDVKFQESQVDVFEVAAVNLGGLNKIEIGHDGIGHGNGWFLHKIIIKESEISPRDYTFFCNRWLDDGQDDGKIERTIEVEPLDDSELTDIEISGQYLVTVITAETSSHDPCPQDAQVNMVVYGEEGKTGQILLQPDLRVSQDGDSATCFKPGQTDHFKINVPDIGNIYKIRVSFNEKCEWKGWLLRKIVMENVTTKTQLIFYCNRWLSTIEDDRETIREIAVARDGEEPFPVLHYHVAVTTGDRPGASTDANISLTLRGERGDSGKRQLAFPQDNSPLFQRNVTNTFIIEAVDLGKLTEIMIGHDGEGYGAGWFLEKVTVREDEFATLEWLFPATVWLDDHVGDCKTERRLKVLGNCEAASEETELVKLATESSDESIDKGEYYDITVLVGEVMTQGNESITLLGHIQGEHGFSDPINLGEWVPGGSKEFNGKVDLRGVGDIIKIRVEMEDSERELNLLLLNVNLKNTSTGDVLSFYFHRRFLTELGSTSKELPALRSNKPYQKLIKYIVQLNMAQNNKDIGCEGKLSLKLHGNAGDSGYRTLFRGMNGFKATKKDGGYQFQLEAVDLGDIKKISLNYSSTVSLENDHGWLIMGVLVRIPILPNSFAGDSFVEATYKVDFNQVFDISNDNVGLEKEYDLVETSLKEDVLRLKSATKGHNGARPMTQQSEGKWKLVVTTSDYNQDSIFNHFNAKIFGNRGASKVVDFTSQDIAVENLENRKGEIIRTLTSAVNFGGQVGDLSILRLTLNKETTVKIYKVKLKDLATNQEYLVHLTAAQRLKPNEDKNGKIVFNLSLFKPDQADVKYHKYEVKVTTGKRECASTDADIHLNIFGKLGSTGARSLVSLSDDPHNLFIAGNTDTFYLETLDIGEPRKIVVGHSKAGFGAGWFLNDVSITESRDGRVTSYLFPCSKWFDDSVDDKLTEREIYGSGTKIEQDPIEYSKSKGKWKCSICTKPNATDKGPIDVNFSFCMSENHVTTMSQRISDSIQEVDVILENDVTTHPGNGEVMKSWRKLRTELENSDTKEWPLEEILMIDQDTGEQIRFVYDTAPAWKGSGRDKVRELPVVRPNYCPNPVVEYYVIFYTAQDSNKTFSPTSIKLKLNGNDFDSGWRNIYDSGRDGTESKFQPGRIEVFTMESVTFGDVIESLNFEVIGSSKSLWKLDKIKVKKGYYDDKEQIFQYNKVVAENEVIEVSAFQVVSIPTKIPISKSPKINYLAKATWIGALPSSDDETKTEYPEILFQLTGSNGESELTKIELEKAKIISAKKFETELSIDVNGADLGKLLSVGLGYFDPALPTLFSSDAVKLSTLTIWSKDTNDYYCFRPNHSFVGNSNSNETGLNWMELVASRPKQDPETITKVCRYVITLRTSDQQDAGTNANTYVTIFGKNLNCGKRWLMRSKNGDDVIYRPGGEVAFEISAKDLGDLTKVIVGHDGRDVTSGWHLDNVTVTPSLNKTKKFVFVCKKWLANLEEDTFIERTLLLDHVDES